jgi:hypothetical protein
MHDILSSGRFPIEQAHALLAMRDCGAVAASTSHVQVPYNDLCKRRLAQWAIFRERKTGREIVVYSLTPAGRAIEGLGA